jgi:hypothetical protein
MEGERSIYNKGIPIIIISANQNRLFKKSLKGDALK